jgi:DNA-binding GntR family transcriptional regulator
LARLTGDGFIENVRGTGAFVRVYSIQDAEILFYVREVLEGASARFAAQRIGRAQAAELQSLAEEMRAVHAIGHGAELAAMDAQFHMKIAEATGSEVLRCFIETHLDLKVMIIGSAGITSGEAVICEHQAIVEAISLGHSDLAEQLMRGHIRRGSQANLRWMRSKEGSGAGGSSAGEKARSGSLHQLAQSTAYPETVGVAEVKQRSNGQFFASSSDAREQQGDHTHVATHYISVRWSYHGTGTGRGRRKRFGGRAVR